MSNPFVLKIKLVHVVGNSNLNPFVKNSEFGCEMKISHRFDCAIGVVVGGHKISVFERI
jgi:hypothetical protein